jgi:hypothetical protein
LLSLGHPSVDVNMLVLCLWLACLADEHVIELLAVHIKEVSISLELRNVCSFVEISQVGDLFEVLDRLDKGELVKVTSDDDLGLLVLSEDFGNEVLCDISLRCYKSRVGFAYGSQLHLFLAVIDTTIDRGTSISFDRGRASFASEVDVDGEE